MGCTRAILCIIFPPLAVLDRGCGTVVIVLLLTIAGWIPGVIAKSAIPCECEVLKRRSLPRSDGLPIRDGRRVQPYEQSGTLIRAR